jgi:hypothetical protein
MVRSLKLLGEPLELAADAAEEPETEGRKGGGLFVH